MANGNLMSGEYSGRVSKDAQANAPEHALNQLVQLIQTSAAQAQQGQGGMIPNVMQNMDPLNQARQKELEKLGKQQVQEAYQAGVPLEDMQAGMMKPTQEQMTSETIRQAGANPQVMDRINPAQQPTQGQIDATTLAQMQRRPEALERIRPTSTLSEQFTQNVEGGIDPTKYPENKLQQKPTGLTETANQLLSLGGILQQTPRNQALLAQRDLYRQELAGQTPMQVGEADKIVLEGMIKNEGGEGKPMSAESAKLLSNAESGIKQLNALSSAFEKDPKLFTRPQLTEAGQQTDLMIADVTDILGRLRSGGAINAEEFKSFVRQLPKRGAIAGRIEKPSTVKLKIKKLNDLFENIRQRVEPNRKAGNMALKIQQARAAGYSMDEIMSRLK